jgi:signal peptidase I
MLTRKQERRLNAAQVKRDLQKLAFHLRGWLRGFRMKKTSRNPLLPIIGTMFAVLFVLCLLKFISANSYGAEVSSLPVQHTKAQALRIASMWVRADPARHSWSYIAATGSMRPLFDHNCVALLTVSDGTDIAVGDIVVYDWEKGQIIHEVVALGKTAVITSGRNNHRSDGWIPRKNIRFRAEIIRYFPE